MFAPQTEVDTRRRLNPLFNDNKLKLGLFGVNVSNGCAITTAEDRHTVSWPTNLAIAQTADKYGYEAMVPVARWRGFGGESNFNGTNFETYTWAAGLGQATQNICVLTTSHVPTIHPIVAAKQATRSTTLPMGVLLSTLSAAGLRPSSRCSACRKWNMIRATTTRLNGSRS